MKRRFFHEVDKDRSQSNKKNVKLIIVIIFT